MKQYKEGVDFNYIISETEGTTVSIKLILGEYADIIYQYGKVKFEEKNDEMHLLFQYDVLESKVDKPKKLEKDLAFKNYIGDLLVEIMGSNIDEEVIDETGTSDINQPDLQ